MAGGRHDATELTRSERLGRLRSALVAPPQPYRAARVGPRIGELERERASGRKRGPGLQPLVVTRQHHRRALGYRPFDMPLHQKVGVVLGLGRLERFIELRLRSSPRFLGDPAILRHPSGAPAVPRCGECAARGRIRTGSPQSPAPERPARGPRRQAGPHLRPRRRGRGESGIVDCRSACGFGAARAPRSGIGSGGTALNRDRTQKRGIIGRHAAGDRRRATRRRTSAPSTVRSSSSTGASPPSARRPATSWRSCCTSCSRCGRSSSPTSMRRRSRRWCRACCRSTGTCSTATSTARR